MCVLKKLGPLRKANPVEVLGTDMASCFLLFPFVSYILQRMKTGRETQSHVGFLKPMPHISGVEGADNSLLSVCKTQRVVIRQMMLIFLLIVFRHVVGVHM